MSRLSPAELRTRLTFDYENVASLRSRHLGPIEPFVSESAFRAGVAALVPEGEGGLVRLYKVRYRFPILVGERQTTAEVNAKFDLLSGGNYPFTEPTVTCVSLPLPWSPHVHPTSGLVCLGRGWRDAGGRMLAAQLIVHVMHLLNCDEPVISRHYGGWNAPAASYWRDVLKARPLNPELEYPLLDARSSHGFDDPASLFRAALAEPPPEPATDGFRELWAPGDGGFEPVG